LSLSPLDCVIIRRLMMAVHAQEDTTPVSPRPRRTSYGQDGFAGGVYFQMYDEVPIPEFSHVATVTVSVVVVLTLIRRQRSANRS
jgi:hypothetical protein